MTTQPTYHHNILVVDDDPEVLDSLVDELSANYDVMKAKTAEQAWDVLTKNRFDAIISDVRMPGMDGVELMRKIKSMDQDIIRILLTGYTDDTANEAAQLPNGVYKLNKPWGDELEIILRRALEHQGYTRDVKKRIDYEKLTKDRAEMAVYKLDKMASLGMLASGIAHEMRTPLAYLQANFSWLKDETDKINSLMLKMSHTLLNTETKNPQIQDFLAEWSNRVKDNILSEFENVYKDCDEGIKRLDDILKGIGAYAAPTKKGKTEQTNISQCIDQAIKLVGYKYKHTVNIFLKNNSKNNGVFGQEGELCQIIINLVTNAIQAMNGKGEVNITVDREDNFMAVTVSDSGPGIAKEIVPRLFETFFTTKQDFSNGLGLPISKEIAKRNGGDLTYQETNNAKGATFKLTLRCAD